MSMTSGEFAENDIIYSFDKHKLSELPNNLREFATGLFGPLEEETEFRCARVPGFQKPDISLQAHGITKRVSIKTGNSRIVHSELFSTFYAFLESLELPSKHLRTFQRWISSDGTLDMSGPQKLSALEKIAAFRPEIEEWNEFIESRKDIQVAIFRRAVIDGTESSHLSCDGFYHGTASFGTLATTDQILRWLGKKNFRWLSNLHVGPLVPSPKFRDYVGNVSSAIGDVTILFRWAGEEQDLPYIRSHYGSLGK